MLPPLYGKLKYFGWCEGIFVHILPNLRFHNNLLDKFLNTQEKLGDINSNHLRVVATDSILCDLK